MQASTYNLPSGIVVSPRIHASKVFSETPNFAASLLARRGESPAAVGLA